MASNEQKYKAIFEKRYGVGSFDSGLSSANNIGKLKAQAEFAKSEYTKRRREEESRAKKAAKEAEKKAEKEQTIYGDMPGDYSRKLQEKAKDQGRGGHQPTYENKLKEKAAVKKGKEKAKENKLVPDLETMTPYQKQLRGFEPSWDKPKKEKKKESGLSKLISKLKKSEVGKAAKAAEGFFNPFDKIKAKDAVTSYINSDKSDSFKEVARGANRAVDSASLGIMSNLDKKDIDLGFIGKKGREPYYNSQRKFGDGGGKDMFSTGLGYLVPGVGAYKAMNATKAGKGLTQFGSQGLKQRLASEAAKGSAIGAAMSGAEVGVREGLNPDDHNWKQNLGYVGLSTAAGAIADPALYGAGRAIGNGLSKFAKGNVPTFSGGPSENILNGLKPNVRKSATSSNNLYDSLINNSRQPKYEVPEGQRVNPQVEPTQRAVNPVSEEYNKEYQEAIQQQYQYLKNSMGKGVDHGTTSNGLAGNFREVSGSYNVSRNPKWYQDFYATNGRKPNNSELMELAEQHVKEGFQDEGGTIPAWQPKAVQEIDDEIDNVMRILGEQPEQEAALQPILKALEEDRAAALDSLNGKSQLRPGRDFEPIESAPLSRETINKAKRDADELEYLHGNVNSDANIHKVPIEIGKEFDAHGIYTGSFGKDFDNLINILDNGIDTTRSFHTAPLMGENLAGLGGASDGAYKNGSFILLGDKGKLIKDGGVKSVIVNDAYYGSIDDLQKSYPTINFIKANEAPNSLLKLDLQFFGENAAVGARELLDTQRQASGDMSSFRGKVDRKPVKNETSMFSNLRTQFIDDVAPLETIEKQIAGKVDSAENSLYKQARLFKGSPEKAHLIVKEQLHPVLKDLQKSGLSHQDLGDYALAVHARDVNAKGINSGFNNAEIDDVIRNLGSEKMEAARVKLLGVNNNVLDMLSSGGIIDDAQIAGMREKWPNYVSLFRSFDDDKIDFAGGMGKAMANATSPIKKLEGSNRAVVDPMESIIKNIFKATNTVDRNKVGTQIANLAEKDTEGAFIKRVADNDETSRMNVVSVMNNGKKVKYEVPPEVYRTLTNMDKESSNTLIKILQKPASLLRQGATLTPEFSLRNPLRDVPNAFVVSNSGFNPLIDFPVGLWQSIWKGRTIKIGNKEFKTSGDLYKQFIKENGGYGNILSMDRKLHQETLKKALIEVNTNYVDVLNPKTYGALMKKFANPKDPLSVLRTIADVSETATKVGEFRAATRKGVSPQEAAYRARDIMDFGMAGLSVREANKVVAFLNANIQGKNKLYRAFKANPVKVTGRAVAAVTIPTIGVIAAQNTYANDKQKQIIGDAPKWLKDTFWLLPVPGTNQIARIPKPFDLAYPFANTLERAFDYVAKHDKEAFDGFIKQSFSAASIPVMLTGIAPIVEGIADYSFFRQSPIIPQREKGVEYPDQHDVNTTETAKFIGKQVNKVTGGVGAFKNFGSPRVVDNTIRGFTAGLGTYATSVIDMFAKGGEGEPVRPEKSIDQMPLARAFLVNQNSSGDSLDKLYNLKDKLTKARGSAKENQKPFVDEGKYKAVNNVTKSIGELNKQIRFIENNPTMSAKEKKSTLDRLIEQRNTVSRQAMENFKNME